MDQILDLACEGCTGRHPSEALYRCPGCLGLYCSACLERNGCPTECQP